ncbi:MAG: pitrilysin family protein [Alphaproteobacteria bacterium]|nr:pitrilysin family protein [Alphaproteobacteria bacterium]
MIAPISTYPFSLWERGAAIIAFAFLFLSVPAHAAEKVLDVQVIKSPAGIEAWLVEDHSVPVISVNFSFEGGLALDPANKPGVGRLVSILLDEGAGDLDSQGFQEKLSENAISLSFSSGRDDFTGQLKTLTAHQDTAFDLLTLALTKPRFDKDAITRMKNANTSGIKDDLGDPSWLVARTFNGMLFAGHNYARPGYGHLASMESITRKDLVDFTARQFTRNGLKVAIAGDITKDAAAAMLDLIFGALPEKPAPPLPQTGHTNLKHGGKIILLPIDTPQTYISAGSEGISHHDKDWHAAVVMNYILGGGAFDARLMKEIREKRGLTYG